MIPKLSLITTAPAPVSAAAFADTMSALASGVVIVTCRLGGRPWGMTVTAFASVSADPPIVLISLDSDSRGAQAIAATHRFGVSILAAEQLEVAQVGSTPGAAKFLERFAEPDRPGAAPVVRGALAHLDCDLAEAVEVADHTIFFGHVRAVRSTHAGSPLVYHGRRYRTLAGDPTNERSTRWLAN